MRPTPRTSQPTYPFLVSLLNEGMPQTDPTKFTTDNANLFGIFGVSILIIKH